VANENRIVRVRHEKIHDLLEWCSEYCGVTYQLAFEEFLKLIAHGYVFGTHTNVMLVDRIRKRIKEEN
jgi:predicted 3-demethylubiquinone-9 3-methyltransferase (glyoxalase superfamily)